MKKELSEKIIENSPKIFPKDFYFECFDGWFNLINQLSIDISKVVEEESNTDFKVAQIKEKFGGLRYYYHGGCASSKIDELIGVAEAVSYSICEECGAPGEIRKGGWIRTLCDEHALKSGRRLS